MEEALVWKCCRYSLRSGEWHVVRSGCPAASTLPPEWINAANRASLSWAVPDTTSLLKLKDLSCTTTITIISLILLVSLLPSQKKASVTVEECWMYSMMLSLSDLSSSGGLDNNSSPEDSPTLYSDSILQNIPSTHYRLKHSGLDSVDCNYDNLEKFVFKVPSFRGLAQHVMSHIVYKDWWLKSSTQQSHTFRVINHNQWTIKLGHSLTALYYWSRSNLSQHFMKCSKSLEKYQQGCKVFNFIKLKTLVLM